MSQSVALRVLKNEDAPEEHMVYAEVYAPNRPDSQGEFMRADTIKKMAHDFAKNLRLDQLDTEHNNEVVPSVCIVESFIARKGDPDFIEGSWVVGIHVEDEATWQAIKSGELNGLSLEAFVNKEEQEVVIEIPPVVTGHTSKSEEHEHAFYVTYDAEGNFKGGVTSTVNGHYHEIRAGTVTEFVKGHSHRFSSVDNVEIH